MAPMVAAFTANGGQDRYRARTGLPLATYFSGLKIRWILDAVADARAQAEAGDLLFGTIDYLSDLETYGRGARRRTRHRRDQRQPHSVDESGHPAMG